MDETGVMLSKLGSVKVIVGKDDPRDYRGTGVKRTMVTAIECISGDGRSLSPLIIWPASTHRSNWSTYETPGWHYAYSENGYNDSYISLQWLKQVFDCETKELAQGKPRILICDGFGTHETLEVLEFCLENNIVLCRLPSHTSHKLQPCDVGVFGPLKTAYRNQVERLSQGGVDTVGKEDFTSLYSPARKVAITKRNIKAAWAATGLFPLNPERVLRATPKPAATLTTPQPNEVAGSCLHEEMETPVTPITAEAFTSLHNLIEENAQGLDETSKQRIRKLASATQIVFAKQALLQDQNRLLTEINSEVKTRRSTRSVVLRKDDGKGKVMSYAELEEARAKRAAKDNAAAVKGKRGRKRKSPAPELEPEPEKGPTEPQAKIARRSQMEENTQASRTEWTAPVAQMY